MQPSAELYPWISAGAIAWGILDCFFGYRVFKVTLAVLGGLIGVLAAQATGLAFGFGHRAEIVAMIAGGLLGAGLAFLLYIAAVFVAGLGFGATLGILLLSNYNHMVALLTGCVLGVISGFLAVKVQQVLIMLSTALLGAFRALLALSYFTIQLDWLYYFQQPQQFPALIDSNVWMFPSILALAAVGVIAQFELGGLPGKKKTKTAGE
ncbi:MAG: TMEM198/TM7SF3 family protein [Lacunisphaera sp.]|nr:TMEM198/TM7SF3 family protein [Lacunisphaera sp.]